MVRKASCQAGFSVMPFGVGGKKRVRAVMLPPAFAGGDARRLYRQLSDPGKE